MENSQYRLKKRGTGLLSPSHLEAPFPAVLLRRGSTRRRGRRRLALTDAGDVPAGAARRAVGRSAGRGDLRFANDAGLAVERSVHRGPLRQAVGRLRHLARRGRVGRNGRRISNPGLRAGRKRCCKQNGSQCIETCHYCYFPLGVVKLKLLSITESCSSSHLQSRFLGAPLFIEHQRCLHARCASKLWQTCYVHVDLLHHSAEPACAALTAPDTPPPVPATAARSRRPRHTARTPPPPRPGAPRPCCPTRPPPPT